MAFPKLNVWVQGQPAGLTAPASVATPWKQRVADAVRQQWHSGYLSEPCTLTLVFHLDAWSVEHSAVYNLLKATIDGASNVLFAPGSYGARGPWNREDWWITRVHARKQLTQNQSGVAIILSPAGRDTANRAERPVVDVTVPGSPPLWVNNRPKELAWREQLIEKVNQLDAPKFNKFVVDFEFRVAPDKMQSADIDNYIVPAAQSTTIAMLGSVYSGTRLTSLSATKSAVGRGTQMGTRVRVWSES